MGSDTMATMVINNGNRRLHGGKELAPGVSPRKKKEMLRETPIYVAHVRLEDPIVSSGEVTRTATGSTSYLVSTNESRPK